MNEAQAKMIQGIIDRTSKSEAVSEAKEAIERVRAQLEPNDDLSQVQIRVFDGVVDILDDLQSCETCNGLGWNIGFESGVLAITTRCDCGPKRIELDVERDVFRVLHVLQFGTEPADNLYPIKERPSSQVNRG